MGCKTTDVASIILLSTLAGLETGIGGLIVLVRKPGDHAKIKITRTGGMSAKAEIVK